MPTRQSRQVLISIVWGTILFANSISYSADYNQKNNFGTKKSGDIVSFTVTPPGTVLTGAVTIPGGFVWTGGPANWNGTIPSTYAGAHAGQFDGTWTRGGSGGTTKILTWHVDTNANGKLTLAIGGKTYAMFMLYMVEVWSSGMAQPAPGVVTVTGTATNFNPGESVNHTAQSSGTYWTFNAVQVSLKHGTTGGTINGVAKFKGMTATAKGAFGLFVVRPPWLPE